MNANNSAYIALQLQTCGNSAMPAVLQMLRDSKLSDLCYAYKIRTKPEDKLIEKVRIKVEKKPQYTLANITDVVGLRLVALFRSEMVELFEKVLTAITHKNGINPNPFQQGVPEEIIIYKGANFFDELVPRLKEIASKHCPSMTIREEHSSEGYSSVHLVARLNVTPEKIPFNCYKLPIEIQIRSVFEDAWGEIDHKYGYVIRTGKDTGKPINNPEFVLAHLKVLKRFSDACMEYADTIKTEAMGIPASLVAVRKVVSVPSDQLILDRFSSLGVAKNFIDLYTQARETKDHASAIMDKNPSGARSSYLDAAELFRELSSMVHIDGRIADVSDAEKLAFYYARMNEALCLLSTNERDQVIAAHGIYQILDNQFPNYPLLKMRYGQALGKLGHLDEAIIKLREAGRSAAEIAIKCAVGKPETWPDNLPLTDYEHVSQSQPKLFGYHLWLKIRTLPSSGQQEKFVLFKEAYDVTHNGLAAVEGDTKRQLSIHNNLLYYALGQITRIPKDNAREAVCDQLDRFVDQHLSFIEKNSPNLSELPLSQLDTLMKGYVIKGRQNDAQCIARVLIEKCLHQPDAELDPKETLQLVSLAHRVAEAKVGVLELID